MSRSGLFRSLFVVGPTIAGLAFAGFGGSLPTPGRADTKAQPPPAAADLAKANPLGKLPLSFEVNQGQTDPQVKMLSRSASATMFLTPNAAVLSLPAKGDKAEDSVLRMKLLGANPDAQVSGSKELPGKINYLNADPAKSHTNVPTFARAESKGVYPGIDMAWYGKGSNLEYDFIVAPGADPAAIQLGFEGAKGLRIDRSGDLVMKVGGREVRQHKPVLYQEFAGKKTAVPGRFVLGRNNQVSFSVGSYDATKPLVIDPVLVWSTLLGGSGGEGGGGLELDSAGYVYVAGSTSADFPFKNAMDSTPGAWGGDIFVTKLTPNGSALVYSTYLGGDYSEFATLAIDGAGRAYVTGRSFGFPTTPGAYETAATSGNVIAKLSLDGSRLEYSTYFPRASSLDALDVDHAGEIYVGGYVEMSPHASAPLGTPGAYQETCVNTDDYCSDAFVAKLRTGGLGKDDLAYYTYLGGNFYSENTKDIEVDADGVAYLVGTSYAYGSFPTTAGAYSRQPGGGWQEDIWVAKLRASGGGADDLLYSTRLGGELSDYASKVVKGPDGSIYVTGSTLSNAASGRDFPVTPGAVQTESIGAYPGEDSDAFLVRINPDPDDPTPTDTTDGDPDDLLYSTRLGGAYFDSGSGLAVDGKGLAYLAGTTNSSSFPITPNRLQRRCGCFYNFHDNSNDAFIAVVNPDPDNPNGGTGDRDDLLFSSWLGKDGTDGASDLELDSKGKMVVAGGTGSADFPTTKGVVQRTHGGESDAWIAKIDAALYDDVVAAR